MKKVYTCIKYTDMWSWRGAAVVQWTATLWPGV